MAEVYVGVQDSLDRKVAIKALLPEYKDNREVIARFHREAETLASLHHENIVAVHDLVEKYNRLYMIMEYVDGVDLASLLQEKAVPLDIGLIIGSRLASALEHAHFLKVLHRDLKPANVMLSRSGQVKLTDFGIAKDQTKDDLTRAGVLVGTLYYLSPEQVSGQSADWRSDIYSLGVLLFEALTGSRPFTAEKRGFLLARIVKGERPGLRETAPNLPRSVEKIVHRCLMTDPAKRYQRAADLRRDIDRLLNAVLEGTPSARLMAFLKERGQVDSKAMSAVAVEEVASTRVVSGINKVLDYSRPNISPRPRSFGRSLARAALIVMITLLILAGAATITYILAPDWVREMVSKTAAWLQSVKSSGLP
jgi:serine/threonine-protein kinase